MAPKKVKATSPGGKPRSVQGRVQAWLVLLIWAPAIFYRERLAFSLAGASCQWPSLDGGDGAQSTGDLPPVRIAVVADPQLTTHLSYRELGRGTPGLTAVEAISDAYMSRAFRKAVLTNDPDHVLFLGDLIDQGENIADPAEWHEARRRFDRIFRWPRDDDPSSDKDDGAGVDDARGTSRRMSYLTVHGNHDVGYSRFAARYGAVHARHERYFGSTNFVRGVGGVDLVGVGAMALDGAEDPGAQSVETKVTWAFVKSLDGVEEGDGVEERDGVEEGDGVEGRCVGEPPRPRVLVTHVPLSKRSYEPGSCGDQRGSPVIRDKTHMNVTVAGRRREIPRHDGLGCLYQDYLRPETSRRVLDAVRPTLVLSGHHHDQCVGTHEVFEMDAKEGRHVCGTPGVPRSATEHTIGSFSFLMGNPRPTFAMVSFVNGERECGVPSAGLDPGHTCPAGAGGIHGEAAAKVSLCYLPSQWNTARVYIALGVVTAVASIAGIVADARRGARRMRAAVLGVVATLGTCAVVAGVWAGLLLADLSAP